VVFLDRFTVGFEKVELYPDDEFVHEYILPETAVDPNEILEPKHIFVSEIIGTVGNGFILIVTELDFVHPFEFVSVRVYELVEAGETEGFETVELNPEPGLV